MIHKYNLVSLKERFKLTNAEIEAFIKVGLLLPIGWREKNDRDRRTALREFSFIWSLEEVERFSEIISLVKDKHLHFYHMVSSEIRETRHDVKKMEEYFELRFRDVLHELSDLKHQIEDTEKMIDVKTFCEVTGYAEQTFRNNIKATDDSGLVGRLQLPDYKNLVWHKIKGKWQVPEFDFTEIRRGLKQEQIIDEKKRNGTFVPKKRINIDGA